MTHNEIIIDEVMAITLTAIIVIVIITVHIIRTLLTIKKIIYRGGLYVEQFRKNI